MLTTYLRCCTLLLSDMSDIHVKEVLNHTLRFIFHRQRLYMLTCNFLDFFSHFWCQQLLNNEMANIPSKSSLKAANHMKH